jgi:hypothetical protein
VVDGSSVKISLNFSTSFGEIDVIRRIIDKNNWSRSTGIDGDILWIGKVVQYNVFRINYYIKSGLGVPEYDIITNSWNA